MVHFLRVFCLLTYFVATVLTHDDPMPNGRIVGGTSADMTDYPYMVSVNFILWHKCSASIIHNYWLLTSASCVGIFHKLLRFRVGSSFKDSGGAVHTASQIIRHPKFSLITKEYDIALVKLSGAIEYNNKTRNISIASEVLTNKSSAVVTGWGFDPDKITFPKHLQKVNVNITDLNTCKDIYGRFITENMICAAGHRKGICFFDKGSPLVIEGKLVGIASWFKDCSATMFPQVYTNVAALKNWVTDISGITFV